MPFAAHADVGDAPQAPDYALKRRTKVAMIVSGPKDGILERTTANINDVLNAKLAENTDLEIELVDLDAGKCKSGTFYCFVYEAIDPKKPPSYLIVLSALKQGQAYRLSTVLIDAKSAVDLVRAPGSVSDEDVIEDQITQFAIRATAPPETLNDAKQLDAYLDKLISQQFRVELERGEHWLPYGTLVIENDTPGFEIEIDGTKVGTTKPGRTVIGSVPRGTRSVRLSLPGYEDAVTTVEVKPRETFSAELTVVRQRDETAHVVRDTVFWGGIGFGVVGAAVVGYALSAASSTNVKVLCLRAAGSDECKGGSEWFKTNTHFINSQESPTPDSAVPIAPVGIGLAVAGATWSLTSLLMNDDQTMPWLEIGLGIAAGVAVSSALIILDNDAGPNATEP